MHKHLLARRNQLKAEEPVPSTLSSFLLPVGLLEKYQKQVQEQELQRMKQRQEEARLQRRAARKAAARAAREQHQLRSPGADRPSSRRASSSGTPTASTGAGSPHSPHIPEGAEAMAGRDSSLPGMVKYVMQCNRGAALQHPFRVWRVRVRGHMCLRLLRLFGVVRKKTMFKRLRQYATSKRKSAVDVSASGWAALRRLQKNNQRIEDSEKRPGKSDSGWDALRARVKQGGGLQNDVEGLKPRMPAARGPAGTTDDRGSKLAGGARASTRELKGRDSSQQLSEAMKQMIKTGIVCTELDDVSEDAQHAMRNALLGAITAQPDADSAEVTPQQPSLNRVKLDFSMFTDDQLSNYMQGLFKIGDVHAAGVLQRAELNDILGWSGFGWSASEGATLLGTCDRKSDGLIKQHDFVAVMMQHCRAAVSEDVAVSAFQAKLAQLDQQHEDEAMDAFQQRLAAVTQGDRQAQEEAGTARREKEAEEARDTRKAKQLEAMRTETVERERAARDAAERAAREKEEESRAREAAERAARKREQAEARRMKEAQEAAEANVLAAMAHESARKEAAEADAAQAEAERKTMAHSKEEAEAAMAEAAAKKAEDAARRAKQQGDARKAAMLQGEADKAKAVAEKERAEAEAAARAKEEAEAKAVVEAEEAAKAKEEATAAAAKAKLEVEEAKIAEREAKAKARAEAKAEANAEAASARAKVEADEAKMAERQATAKARAEAKAQAEADEAARRKSVTVAKADRERARQKALEEREKASKAKDEEDKRAKRAKEERREKEKATKEKREQEERDRIRARIAQQEAAEREKAAEKKQRRKDSQKPGNTGAQASARKMDRPTGRPSGRGAEMAEGAASKTQCNRGQSDQRNNNKKNDRSNRNNDLSSPEPDARPCTRAGDEESLTQKAESWLGGKYSPRVASPRVLTDEEVDESMEGQEGNIEWKSKVAIWLRQ